MTTVTDSEGIKYTYVDSIDAYYVGASNISTPIPSNGLSVDYGDVATYTATDSATITSVRIPQKVNGKLVLEIGCT